MQYQLLNSANRLVFAAIKMALIEGERQLFKDYIKFHAKLNENNLICS